MSTLVYAHRGASGMYPENTMLSFRKALEMGCHGIECDVHMSKDGKLVVCHDEKVDRTTNAAGLIVDYTYAQIKKFDAGVWFSEEFKGEYIPLLEELLELVKESGVMLNIELKNGVIMYPNLEKEVIAAVNSYGLKDKVIISSFNHYSLKEVKNIDKEIKTGALYMCGLYEPWNYLPQINCEYAHPFYVGIKPELVVGYKKNGFKINAYTVDDVNIAKQLAMLKVDGIITNYPDKIIEALNSGL